MDCLLRIKRYYEIFNDHKTIQIVNSGSSPDTATKLFIDVLLVFVWTWVRLPPVPQNNAV